MHLFSNLHNTLICLTGIREGVSKRGAGSTASQLLVEYACMYCWQERDPGALSER
jgi:hypothetical protein